MLMTSWIVVAECRRACQRVVFGIGTAWAVRVDHPTHLGSLIKSQIRTPAVCKHRYICHKLLYSLHLPFTEHAAEQRRHFVSVAVALFDTALNPFAQ
jgi:hypothetical protein